MPYKTATRRFLQSSLVDLLVGPHGIDRYLELIRPDLTVSEARARIVAVERQTPRSVTLRLRPNAAWSGFRAGQFVRVGVEIDGVRRTRTYSPASSQYASGEHLELTISFLPDGLVSSYLRRDEPGANRPPGPGRRRVRAAARSVRSVLRCQRRQRRHAGAVDAAHVVRRGSRGRGHLRPLRTHAGGLALRTPGPRAREPRIPTCAPQYVATREGGARFAARQGSSDSTRRYARRRLRATASD